VKVAFCAEAVTYVWIDVCFKRKHQEQNFGTTDGEERV